MLEPAIISFILIESGIEIKGNVLEAGKYRLGMVGPRFWKDSGWLVVN